uniref:Uncharacterized protein n=1 Tax=viral metagenome TaxID=1070528 RepID=A0A6C0IBA3_9ZZZZ
MEYDNGKVVIVIDFIDWLFEMLGIFIINISFFLLTWVTVANTIIEYTKPDPGRYRIEQAGNSTSGLDFFVRIYFTELF